MKEVATFMLARLGGNDKPSTEEVAQILDSVGLITDNYKVDALFADIGKLAFSVDETFAVGLPKLATVCFGGIGSSI